MRIADGHRGIQIDALQQLPNPAFSLLPGTDLMDQQRFHDGKADRKAGVQSRIGILEYILDITPQLLQLRAGYLRKFLPVKHNTARTRGLKPNQRTADSGLSAAGLTHQTKGFAGIQIETHLLHGMDAAFHLAPETGFHIKAGDQVIHTEHGSIRHGWRGSGRFGHVDGRFIHVGGAQLFGFGISNTQQREGSGFVSPPHGPEARDSRQQGLRVGVARVVENLLTGALFHRFPVVHDEYPVSDLRHHAHVVGDEDDRHAHLFLQLPDELEDLRLNGHVERCRRFVGDKQGRLAGQGHRDHDALAHPPGKLVRIPLEDLLGFRDTDKLKHPESFSLGLRVAEPLMEHDRLRYLCPHGEHGVQGGHGLLKNH